MTALVGDHFEKSTGAANYTTAKTAFFIAPHEWPLYATQLPDFRESATTAVATTTVKLIKYRIVILNFCRTVKAGLATGFYGLAEMRGDPENTLVAEVNPLHARNPPRELLGPRIFTAYDCKMSLLRILMINYPSLSLRILII